MSNLKGLNSTRYCQCSFKKRTSDLCLGLPDQVTNMCLPCQNAHVSAAYELGQGVDNFDVG